VLAEGLQLLLLLGGEEADAIPVRVQEGGVPRLVQRWAQWDLTGGERLVFVV